MRESRFIELINLYIDRQISPEEAAELEAEIARSPAHRRTYLQYCRMHRACTLLFENFHVPAGSLNQALEQAEEKMTNFPGRQYRWARMAWGTGLVAAAACVAFTVFVEYPHPQSKLPAAQSQVASIATANMTPPASPAVPVNVPTESFHVVAAPTPAAARPAEIQTAFAPNRYSLASNQAAADAQRAAFDWMNQIELSPMPAVDNNAAIFESRAENQPTTFRFQRTREPDQAVAEMTAFQFQP